MINPVSHYREAVEQIFEGIEERKALGIDCAIEAQDIKTQWANIRKAYKYQLPRIMDGLKNGTFYYPDFMDFRRVMTPIEEYAWDDIKHYGVKMVPQFPVLHYFLDFANPLYKIGLEMDGAQWHNAEKDAKRDTRLALEGWEIIRVKGRYARDERHMAGVMANLHRKTGGDHKAAQYVCDHGYDE